MRAVGARGALECAKIMANIVKRALIAQFLGLLVLAVSAQNADPVLYPPTPGTPTTAADRQFRVVYEWNMMDFAYPSEDNRARALYSGEYIPKNVLISDVKPYANRLYVTVPRMLPGVPATLGYFVRPENNGRTDPEIVPFPSWAMNERGNCSALQFVQGIAIDKYGIMWVVDSGRTETLQRGEHFELVKRLKVLISAIRTILIMEWIRSCARPDGWRVRAIDYIYIGNGNLFSDGDR